MRWEPGHVYMNKTSGHFLLCVANDVFVWLTRQRDFKASEHVSEWHVWRTPDGKIPVKDEICSVEDWRRDFVRVMSVEKLGEQLIEFLGDDDGK